MTAKGSAEVPSSAMSDRAAPHVEQRELGRDFRNPDPGSTVFARFLRGYAVRLLALAACALAIRGDSTANELFLRQDLPVIGLSVALLLCLSAWPHLLRNIPAVSPPRHMPALLVGLVFVVAASGTWLVFGNFDLTRDEFMANFDADVFASGRRAWPIAAEWRPFSDALMPLFMRGIPVEAGWISNYLPGNALLRALAQLTIGREFASPAMAAVAALATWRIARTLWPQSPRRALIPVLLLTLSPQFLVTAMTPFAATSHLAFNLLWLLCFLQDNRRGDACALAFGFVATGLHQILFHPLFVAPFIVELLIARRFRRAGLFIAGYGLISLFWALYPQLFQPLASTVSEGGRGATDGLSQLAGTIVMLLSTFKISNILLMLLNLLRFAAWQHILLLVLVGCAWPAIKQAQGIARPLLAGVVLLLIATFILIPEQGHGWGYRYLHGFLGSFCLLAGYGWQRFDRFADERRAALMLTTAAMAVLVMPFQMIRTHNLVAPYRTASAAIRSSGGDVVLIDGSAIPFTVNLVRNAALPDGGPKVMDLQTLSGSQVIDLCARYDVRLFDARHALKAGIALMPLTAATPAPAIGCGKPLPL